MTNFSKVLDDVNRDMDVSVLKNCDMCGTPRIKIKSGVYVHTSGKSGFIPFQPTSWRCDGCGNRSYKQTTITDWIKKTKQK
jgi:hypothetical protein